MEKVCTRCEIPKDINEFSPVPQGRFGVSGRCRQCIREVTTERRNADPSKREQGRMANEVSRLARIELSKRHADEYRTLVDEIREQKGLRAARKPKEKTFYCERCNSPHPVTQIAGLPAIMCPSQPPGEVKIMQLSSN